MLCTIILLLLCVRTRTIRKRKALSFGWWQLPAYTEDDLQSFCLSGFIMVVSWASVVFGRKCHGRRLPLLLLLVGLACSGATEVVDVKVQGKGGDGGRGSAKENYSAVAGASVEAMEGTDGEFDGAGCTVLQHTTTYK